MQSVNVQLSYFFQWTLSYIFRCYQVKRRCMFDVNIKLSHGDKVIMFRNLSRKFWMVDENFFEN